MKIYEKILKNIAIFSEAYGDVQLFNEQGEETSRLEDVRKILIKPLNWMISFNDKSLKFFIYTTSVRTRKFMKWFKYVKKTILKYNYDYNLKIIRQEGNLREMKEDVLINKEKYEEEKKLLAKYLYKILQITTIDKLIEILRKLDVATTKDGKKVLVDKNVYENEEMVFDSKDYSDAERKLAKILRLLDLASGGYPSRKEDAKPKEYLEQARRILKKQITGKPVKVIPSEDEYTSKANFYAAVSEAITNPNDAIIANIASRLSDYYEGLANGYTTDLDKKYLHSLEGLVNTVAKMVGVKKPEKTADTALKEYFDWLKSYKPENIIKESTKIENKGEEKSVKVEGKTYKVVIEDLTEKEDRPSEGYVCFTDYEGEKLDDVMMINLRNTARKILENLGFPPKTIGDLPEKEEGMACFVIDYPINFYVKEKVSGPYASIPAASRLKEEILEGDRQFFSKLITKMISEKENPLRLKRMVSLLSEEQILRLVNVIKEDLKSEIARKLINPLLETVKNKKTVKESLNECSCGCNCKCDCGSGCGCGCNHNKEEDDVKMDPLQFMILTHYPKTFEEQKRFLSQLEFSKGVAVASQCERLFAGNPLSTCDTKSLENIATFARIYGYEDMAEELEDYINAVDECNDYNYSKTLTFEGTIENPSQLLTEVKRRYDVYVTEQCLNIMSGFPVKEQNRKALELIYDVALDTKEIDFANFLRKAINL